MECCDAMDYECDEKPGLALKGRELVATEHGYCINCGAQITREMNVDLDMALEKDFEEGCWDVVATEKSDCPVCNGVGGGGVRCPACHPGSGD